MQGSWESGDQTPGMEPYFLPGGALLARATRTHDSGFEGRTDSIVVSLRNAIDEVADRGAGVGRFVIDKLEASDERRCLPRR